MGRAEVGGAEGGARHNKMLPWLARLVVILWVVFVLKYEIFI